MLFGAKPQNQILLPVKAKPVPIKLIKRWNQSYHEKRASQQTIGFAALFAHEVEVRFAWSRGRKKK